MSNEIRIPKVSDMAYDEDCPWVLTYRDDGPSQPSPGGGWPSRFALLFKDEQSARDYWDEHRHRAGRNMKVDLLPLRRPAINA